MNTTNALIVIYGSLFCGFLAYQRLVLNAEKVAAEIACLTAKERERSAKIAEQWRSPYGGPRDLEVAQAIAAAIRGDGE